MGPSGRPHSKPPVHFMTNCRLDTHITCHVRYGSSQRKTINHQLQTAGCVLNYQRSVVPSTSRSAAPVSWPRTFNCCQVDLRKTRRELRGLWTASYVDFAPLRKKLDIRRSGTWSRTHRQLYSVHGGLSRILSAFLRSVFFPLPFPPLLPFRLPNF